MSKKRRTKKEKVQAETRHEFLTVLTPMPIEIKLNTLPENRSEQAPIQRSLSRSHTYVAKDIRSTLAITFILLAANIAIFVFLKLQLINLFGIIF